MNIFLVEFALIISLLYILYFISEYFPSYIYFAFPVALFILLFVGKKLRMNKK